MKLKINTKIVLLLFFFLGGMLSAQNIRPIRDRVGFCWNSKEFARFINYLKEHSESLKDSMLFKPVAAISPHDDYLYAGKVYFPLYKYVRAKEILIFGVTHSTVRRAVNDPKGVLIFDYFDFWRGPYGKIEISPLREKLEMELNKEDYIVSNKAQSIEHSIEALIPFLQYYNREIVITPVMVTKMTFDRNEMLASEVAKIVTEYISERNYKLGEDIFILISNDANHYGKDFDNYPYGLDSAAHAKAVLNDRRIISERLECKIEKAEIKKLTSEIWEGVNSDTPLWCGRYPVVFGLSVTEKIVLTIYNKPLYGKLLKYSDTLSEGGLNFEPTNMGFTAPVSEEHWVGFFSMLFGIK